MKSSINRILLIILGAGLIAFASSGCQTTKGFGKDVEKVGEKIQGDK